MVESTLNGISNFLSAYISFANLNSIIFISVHLAAALISFFKAENFFLKTLNYILGARKPQWVSESLSLRTFEQLNYFLPLVIIYSMIHHYGNIYNLHTTYKFFDIALTTSFTILVTSFLRTIGIVYKSYSVAKKHPITIYAQLLSLLIYIISAIIIICILLDKSPVKLLSGLGAAMALIVLIFKDTMLSLIASVQIIANDLIEQGDWVQIPSMDIDGAVQEITLNFVKIRNWENAIVTVPTYKLVETSFKNWRNVFDSRARRIKTSLFINQATIKFITPAAARETLASPVLHKCAQQVDLNFLGESFTNLTLFRIYAQKYLDTNPDINMDFTHVVRLLDASAVGMPIEIYCFSNKTSFPDISHIKSSIQEHLIAVSDIFSLKVFQYQTDYE